MSKTVESATLPARQANFTTRSAIVAVIGLGRAGLPLAVAFAEAGFAVTGIDVDATRVAAIQEGCSPLTTLADARLQPLIAAGRLAATTDYAAVATCDAAIICVPTPLNKTRDPDVRQVLAAGEMIARHMRPGLLVVLESTTPPGTTEELLLPILAHAPAFGGAGVVGEDFFLAHAPERLDPGRAEWTIATTPRVLGGVTPGCRQMATALFSQIVHQVVPVSSPTAAEMTKVFENTFRAVNIALANEMTMLCDRLGMDVREVLDAAATKPYGFMRFAPGPGTGGDPMTLDDPRLTWKVENQHKRARFIQLAAKVNRDMPRYWVEKVQDALNQAGKALRGSQVLVLGVAYKRDTDDVRESAALDVIDLLLQKGAVVGYHDPHVASFTHTGTDFHSTPDLAAALSAADCVLIVTDHGAYDWPNIAQAARLLVDTRSVLAAQPA